MFVDIVFLKKSWGSTVQCAVASTFFFYNNSFFVLPFMKVLLKFPLNVNAFPWIANGL